MNRYKITFNGYTLPTEIMADDFYIEPDTGNAIFHDNGCDMRKVATVKEYSNIILLQEDEIKKQIENYILIVDYLSKIYNKKLKMYKFTLLIFTLIIISIFAYFINI
jgi:hypothetical protein